MAPKTSKDSEGRKGRMAWIKALLSVFLLYHLFTVILLPNSSSLAGRQMSRYVIPYGNLFGFNTTWQFFSPGPAPTFFLEYEIETADSYDLPPEEPRQYPDPRQGYSWSESFNRRFYGMRFFALDTFRLERFFIPFLCRMHPEAEFVTVQGIFEKIPAIERANEWADFKEMSERFTFPRQRFSCPEKEDAPESEEQL
jgi:hypothetical protein